MVFAKERQGASVGHPPWSVPTSRGSVCAAGARHLRADGLQRGERLHVVRDHREQQQRRRDDLVADAFERDLLGARGGALERGGGWLGVAQPEQLRLGHLRHLLARKGVDHSLELRRDVDSPPLLHLDERVDLLHGLLVLDAEELGGVGLQLGAERRVCAWAQVRHVAHKLLHARRHAHEVDEPAHTHHVSRSEPHR